MSSVLIRIAIVLAIVLLLASLTILGIAFSRMFPQQLAGYHLAILGIAVFSGCMLSLLTPHLIVA